MAYEIKKRMMMNTIFTGGYDIFIDGEAAGSIEPLFKSENVTKGYQTELMLEHDALSDDSGYPNEYRYLKDAKSAVNDIMEMWGHA